MNRIPEDGSAPLRVAVEARDVRSAPSRAPTGSTAIGAPAGSPGTGATASRGALLVTAGAAVLGAAMAWAVAGAGPSWAAVSAGLVAASALAAGVWLRRRDAERVEEMTRELDRIRERLARTQAELDATLAERQRQTKELARYLPANLVHELTGRGDEAASPARRRRCRLTVCFVDIVGFTSMADSLAPEDLEALLNRYFTVMTEIVGSRGGTLDKFMGDGLMIFFAGEGADAEAASACVRMALDMQDAARRLGEEWEGRGSEVPLRIRIGIATGYCSLGNYGSQSRVQYTAVGSPVNLAARLEAAAEPGGILLAHSTFGLVRDGFVLEPAGQLALKGLGRPIHAYRALREASEDARASALAPLRGP